MKRESPVQAGIIKFLEREKSIDDSLLFFRRQAGGFNYKSGVPDLWVLYKGIHLEIEVKGEGGSPDPLQLKWENRFKKAGALYWRGKSVDQFISFFREIFGEQKP